MCQLLILEIFRTFGDDQRETLSRRGCVSRFYSFPDSSILHPSIILSLSVSLSLSLSLCLATYANIIRRFLGRAKKVSPRAPRVYGRIKDLRGVIQQSRQILHESRQKGNERTDENRERERERREIGRGLSCARTNYRSRGQFFVYKISGPFLRKFATRFVKWNDLRL